MVYGLREVYNPRSCSKGTLNPASFRVGAEAGFKFGEILRGQRTVLFCDSWDIGAGVVDPGVLGLEPFGEEDHVCLGPRAVRRESSIGEAEDGMQIAIFG